MAQSVLSITVTKWPKNICVAAREHNIIYSACECGTDLSLGVAEDDRLRDGQCVIQITQCVELPLFSLHSHEELLNALQRQLITTCKKSRLKFIPLKEVDKEKVIGIGCYKKKYHKVDLSILKASCFQAVCIYIYFIFIYLIARYHNALLLLMLWGSIGSFTFSSECSLL